MPIIQLTKHMGIAGKGGSQAQIFADEHGNQYFVKYKENAQALKVLVNEYIAGKIAKELNLPCPECFVVEIHDDILSTILPINGKTISKGYHFATARVENVYEFPDIRTLIEHCHNKIDYPFIILFDVLSYNKDRNNEGNFLITYKNNKLHFNIIDHGHCFNCVWDENSIRTLIGQWNPSGIKEMYNEITSVLNCNDAIDKIEVLPDIFFKDLITQLPNDWSVNDAEKKSITHYLTSQRNSIRNLVKIKKPQYFTNWI